MDRPRPNLETINNVIIKDSKTRWLSLDELEFILKGYSPSLAEIFGLDVSNDPPSNPKDGELYLFHIKDERHKDALSTIKKDGMRWAMGIRKNKAVIREDYQNMKSKVMAIHTRAEGNKNFRRRIYRAYNASDSPYILVHYRDYADFEEILINKTDDSASNKLAVSNRYNASMGSIFDDTSEYLDILQALDPVVSMWPNSSNGYEIDGSLSQPNDAISSSLAIIDFAPNLSYQVDTGMADRTKLLVCVSDTNFGSGNFFFVDFIHFDIVSGSEYSIGIVKAEVINPGLLRCYSPPLQFSTTDANYCYQCFLQVVNDIGIKGPRSQDVFTIHNIYRSNESYRDTFNQQISIGTDAMGGIHENFVVEKDHSTGADARDSEPFVDGRQTHNAQIQRIDIANDIGHQDIDNQASAGLKRGQQRFRSSSDTSSIDEMTSLTMGMDRAHKIRIVERLNTVNSVLKVNSNTDAESGLSTGKHIGHLGRNIKVPLIGESDAITGFPFESTDVDKGPVKYASERVVGTSPVMEWMDDAELSEINLQDFEQSMDAYITQVFGQLVQLASLDEDLRSELDSLDNHTGFSLFHYCCMYNLPPLVDVLLEKGVNINLKTACGRSALHLAALSGHIGIVKKLVTKGANVFQRDSNHSTPYDYGVQGGSADVIEYLQQVQVTMAGDDNQVNDSIGDNSHSQSVSLVERENIQRDSQSDLNSSTEVLNNLTRSINDQGNTSSGIPGLNAGFQPFTGKSRSKNDLANTSLAMTDDSASAVSANDLYYLGATAFNSSVGNVPAVDTVNVSTILLQEAFSSLSLADKCALNLSLSMSDSAMDIDDTGALIKGDNVMTNNNLSSSGNLDNWDIQSVISELDKESLDVAMSMMGEHELLQVEEEVKKIQSNVRSWILRKNYVNLRDSAKVLQGFWREKRRSTFGMPALIHDNNSSASLSSTISSPNETNNRIKNSSFSTLHRTNTSDLIGPRNGLVSIDIPPEFVSTAHVGSSETQGSLFSHGLTSSDTTRSQPHSVSYEGFAIAEHSYPHTMDRKISAAATLQAVTRGMIARKSFDRIRRQAMASMVIQKSFVSWWNKKDH